MCAQAQGQLSSRKAGKHWSAAPTHQKPCLSRRVLAPSAGMPAFMKRSMSMLCSLVHGNSNQQPGVRATPEDSIPAANSPMPEQPAPVPVAPPAVADAAAAPSPAPSPAPVPVAQGTGPKFGQAYIKVVGCGGGGGNAISRMISAGLQVSSLGCTGQPPPEHVRLAAVG